MILRTNTNFETISFLKKSQMRASKRATIGGKMANFVLNSIGNNAKQ